jgi:hypothetical protein
MIKRQMYGRAKFDLLTPTHPCTPDQTSKQQNHENRPEPQSPSLIICGSQPPGKAPSGGANGRAGPEEPWR